jgi:hypothetical protein
MLIRSNTMGIQGKSCTIVLVQLPPNRDCGVALFKGTIDVLDGVVVVRKDAAKRVRVPPPLVARIEPVTNGLREGFEIDFETETLSSSLLQRSTQIENARLGRDIGSSRGRAGGEVTTHGTGRPGGTLLVIPMRLGARPAVECV